MPGVLRIRARGRGVRRDPGTMNKTEAAYSEVLEARRIAGEIAWWAFEPWKFRLAAKTFLTPDFAVMLPDGTMELHEVKGFMEDDAAVKLKVAAETYWMFRWVVVRKKGKAWEVEEK